MPNRQPEALTASVWLLIASASWRKRSSSTRAGGIAGTWTGGTVRVGTGADIIGGAVWDGAARRAGRAGEGVENVARSGAKSAASDAGIGIDQISATGGGLRRDCERTSWPEMEARRRAGLLLVSGPLWVNLDDSDRRRMRSVYLQLRNSAWPPRQTQSAKMRHSPNGNWFTPRACFIG